VNRDPPQVALHPRLHRKPGLGRLRSLHDAKIAPVATAGLMGGVRPMAHREERAASVLSRQGVSQPFTEILPVSIPLRTWRGVAGRRSPSSQTPPFRKSGNPDQSISAIAAPGNVNAVHRRTRTVRDGPSGYATCPAPTLLPTNNPRPGDNPRPRKRERRPALLMRSRSSWWESRSLASVSSKCRILRPGSPMRKW